MHEAVTLAQPSARMCICSGEQVENHRRTTTYGDSEEVQNFARMLYSTMRL